MTLSKRTRGLKLSLIAASVGLAAQSSRAASIAYEGFDYAAGSTVSGQAGGTGWSAAWTGGPTGPTVTSPGATYPGLATIGLKATAPDSNTGAFRVPISSPDADGTTLYISTIAQNLGGAAGYTGLALFNGTTTEVLYLGKPSGQANWGLDNKGAPAGTFVSTTPATTQSLLVYRIDFGGGTTLGNERVRLYVNPTGPTEPAVADIDVLDKGNFVWDTLRIQAGNGASGTYDELRLATTFADVAPVPEPAALGSLAIAATALVGRRRRTA